MSTMKLQVSGLEDLQKIIREKHTFNDLIEVNLE